MLKFKDLLPTIGECTTIEVRDSKELIHMGIQDGKNTLPLLRVLNNLTVSQIATECGKIIAYVDFDYKRFLRDEFEDDTIWLLNHYYTWLEKNHGIKLTKIDSTYGTLYIDADGYAHSSTSFLERVINRCDDYIEYVTSHLEEFEEEPNI